VIHYTINDGLRHDILSVCLSAAIIVHFYTIPAVPVRLPLTLFTLLLDWFALISLYVSTVAQC